MELEFILAVISRWVHVGTAIVLVGGTAFLNLAVLPSLEGDSADLMNRIRGKWKKVVHAGIALFLLSGFYNYLVVMAPKHAGDKLYHPMVGTKILLAFGIFFLASALVGRSAGTQKFRDNPKKWTGVILLLAAIIVGISGFVKVRPYAPPTDAAETE